LRVGGYKRKSLQTRAWRDHKKDASTVPRNFVQSGEPEGFSLSATGDWSIGNIRQVKFESLAHAVEMPIRAESRRKRLLKVHEFWEVSRHNLASNSPRNRHISGSKQKRRRSRINPIAAVSEFN
jgi:hypothetical protein